MIRGASFQSSNLVGDSDFIEFSGELVVTTNFSAEML